MKLTGVIWPLIIALGLAISGIHRLNQYVHRSGLFPETPMAANVILPGTPPQFQKNKHVKKEITRKKGQYQIKYAFQDHLDIPRIWSVSFPSKETEDMIHQFGVDPEIFKPYEKTPEVYEQRRQDISRGFFYEQNNTVMPDLNAMATYYQGFTKPIAAYATEVLGPEASVRDQLNFVLRFCQDIPYGVPPKTFEEKVIGEMFPPPQMLLNMYGDCDSKAVVFASTMTQLGVKDMAYIFVPGHLLLGVAGLPGPYDAFVKFKNKKYILAEPVGPDRLPFGEGRQAYTRMEGIQEVKIGSASPKVAFEFSELDQDDPFVISVNSDKVKSIPIDPNNDSPGEVFGNQATDDMGQMTVWVNSADFGDVTIFIDDEEIGTITRFFLESPNCGQPGTMSAVRPPGNYNFKAQSGSAVWEGQVTISANSCLMLEIGN